MAPTKPFPFLPLPLDIRLVIYNLLPLTTRHAAIHVRHPILPDPHTYAITLITKRISGISLLCTCRQIYSEADTLHSKMEETRTLPLAVNWRGMGGAAMRAMLMCASPYQCEGGEDLATLLQTPVGDGCRIAQRDFSTHEELHGLLRHGAGCGVPLRVEVAVECGMDILGRTRSLRNEYCWNFNPWFTAKSWSATPRLDMQVVLRLMPVCGEVNAEVRMEEFDGKYLDERYWAGWSWTLTFGDKVDLEEWKEHWEEGVKY